jgi:hypothetical protein
MCLEKLCRTVRNQVLDLGAYLCDEDHPPVAKNARVDLESRCGDLAAEINRRRSLAARFRVELVELRRRLVNHEKKALFLLKRIEILYRVGDQPNAWSLALQLEQLRQLIHCDRSRLKNQERILQEHMARTQRLTERLSDFQELLTL